MTIRFTNTLGGGKHDFEPLAPPRVGVYVCGPTVYDATHIGHARSAVAFDVLRRHLTWRGFNVVFVRNVTDVDDKIIARANELGVDAAMVAERYTREYDDAMRRLNVLPPDIAPRAGAHIPEMIAMIAALVDRGHAYEASGSVWFAVEKFAGYGKLSRQRVDELRAGIRVEQEPGTISPLDFALWKAAKPGEPRWESPWGPGRPGWHIECSAMSQRYLGVGFDIHGGGADLVFPHHENEIAQSEAANGVEPFARVWLHNGHVQIGGETMSKSLRNYVGVAEALEHYAPQVLRLFLVSAHYRSPIAYNAELLDEARAVWTRFEGFLRAAPEGGSEGGLLHAFGGALDDDLNTPQAIAALHAVVSAGHQSLSQGRVDDAAAARAALVTGLGVLGCDTSAPAPASGGDALAGLADYVLDLRERARRDKDFARADEIRDRLAALGLRVEDTPTGARWFLDPYPGVAGGAVRPDPGA